MRTLLAAMMYISCLSGPTVALGMSVIVVDGGEGLPVVAYTQALQERLGEQTVTLKSLDEVKHVVPSDEIYIAAGPRALRGLIELKSEVPILGVLITKSAYLSVIGTAESVRSPNELSAIFADPDPTVQVKLIRLLFPKNASVGVLLGPETSSLAAEIEQAGHTYGVDIRIEKIAERQQVFDALSRLASAKVVLALPDSVIYNKDTLRNILITTYRRGQALIGYSPGMIVAGALATTACAITALANDTSHVVASYSHVKRLPSPRYCQDYGVFLNEQVSESLDITPPSTDILNKKLKSMGGLE